LAKVENKPGGKLTAASGSGSVAGCRIDTYQLKFFDAPSVYTD
jgi:hypothetical protein